MQPQDFVRTANNFYNSKGLSATMERIALDSELINYYATHQKIENKYKVAFVFICLNPLYWQYAPEMVAGARQFFLQGHNIDFLFWTDIPENGVKEKIINAWKERGKDVENPDIVKTINDISIDNFFFYTIFRYICPK